MMITRVDDHRTIRELGSTECRAWCPFLAITSPVNTPVAADHVAGDSSHAYQLHRSVLIGGGRAFHHAVLEIARHLNSIAERRAAA